MSSNKKIVRIWTDVEVEANTEEGAIMKAAVKAIEDDAETIAWNYQVFMNQQEFEEVMYKLESISREGAEQDGNIEPATKN